MIVPLLHLKVDESLYPLSKQTEPLWESLQKCSQLYVHSSLP